MINKVAIIGGESTGKSTLSLKLATELNCLWVPEYARIYLAAHGPKYTWPQVDEMARGQLALEQAMLEQVASNQSAYLICDTNLIVFYVWLTHAKQPVPNWMLERIRGYDYQHTLITEPFMPWQPDPLREHPDLQGYFFDRYQEVCQHFGISYCTVRADLFTAKDLLQLDFSVD